MGFQRLYVCVIYVIGYIGLIIIGILRVLCDLVELFFSFKRQSKSIRDEIAVVTGAGGGLGKAICLELAKQGCHIALLDIDESSAQKVATNLARDYSNLQFRAYKVDITQRNAVLQVRNDIERDFKRTPTILINNAGIVVFKKIMQPEPEELQNMINVNLTAHIWTIEAFMPGMEKQKRGHIAAICSLAAKFPLINFPVYTASKFGIRGLMRALRLELLIDNKANMIRTTIIYPFVMDTNARALKLFEDTKSDNLMKEIGANSAGRSVVRAIQRNELEVTLPHILGFVYPFLEIVPVSVSDWVIKVVCRKASKNMKLCYLPTSKENELLNQ